MRVAPEMHDPFRSAEAAPNQRMAAAERLLGRRHGDAAWFLKRLQDEGWRPQDLWCRAAITGPLVAAGLISEHPGRTATLTIGPSHDQAQVRHAAQLLRDMVAELGRRGTVALAQGMTAAEDPAAGAPFLEAGFADLAVLECMERNNRRNPARPTPSAGVEFAQAGDDASMRALLRATYEETLDCPGLAELRSDADILEGHQRGGNFEPALWTVLRVEGRDAGAALLNRSPANDSIELTYLGLAKWARGKGLGSLLMEEALWKAAQVPERVVALAVDDRNQPAHRLYRRCGFRTVARRRAFAIRVQSST